MAVKSSPVKNERIMDFLSTGALSHCHWIVSSTLIWFQLPLLFNSFAFTHFFKVNLKKNNAMSKGKGGPVEETLMQTVKSQTGAHLC